MQHKLLRFHLRTITWQHVWLEQCAAILMVLLVVSTPVSAAMRLQERSLYINNIEPGATTSYTVSFRYMSPEIVGSVDMLFCVDPIPYHPCVTPAGLDVSGAVLSEQTGEAGFSILSKSKNHIVLTRSPDEVVNSASSYKFDNIVNPTGTDEAFAIRLRTHSSTDASGPQVDFGSVRGQITSGIVVQTQVPPILIFCVAEKVEENCISTNETYYHDMGDLEPGATLTAQSQMSVGTNASAGYIITTHGTPLSAGTTVIDGMKEPSPSQPGSNQFGINLVANTYPTVGNDPEGAWTNAVPAADYSTPDTYKYVPGDVIAYSPNVSLMRKFTVSYVVNSEADLRAGVYSTTITYVASGRF